MSVTMSEAKDLLVEGRKARTAEKTESPYQNGTSEFFWWARGWLGLTARNKAMKEAA